MALSYNVSQTASGPSITGVPTSGTVGQSYGWAPTVTGGFGPRQFSYTGVLPLGLYFFSDSGAIVGVPRSAMSSTGIAVTVTDSSGSATLSNLTIAVADAATGLMISGTPPTGTMGSAYSFTPTVTGGGAGLRFGYDGRLDPGLTFDPATGAIGGTISRPGGSTVTIFAMDNAGRRASLATTIVTSMVTGASGPTLGTPTLSGSLTSGAAASGVSLSGLTDGSTVSLNIPGLSVGTSGAARSVTGTPTASGSLSVTETLSGALGSPKTTTVGTVAAGSPMFAYTALPAVSATIGAVYAMTKVVDAYSGPLFRLVRASDSATMDVSPLASGLPDYSAINTWVGASSAKIDIRYDQSGNALHETQTADANRPQFSTGIMERGVAPCIFSYFPEAVNRRYLNMPAITGLNAQSLGVFQVNSIESLSPGPNSLLAFADSSGSANAFAPMIFSNGLQAPNFTGGRVYPPTRIHRAAMYNNLAATKLLITADGVTQSTASARPAAALTYGGKEGCDATGTSGSANANNFATIIFSTAPSDADIAALNTWADTAFALPQRSSYTRAIAMNGNSLTLGRGESLNQNPIRRGNWPDKVVTTEFAAIGMTLAGAYANISTTDAKSYYPGIPNIFMMCDLTNDVFNTTFTSQADAEAWADALFASSAGTFSGGTAQNTVYAYIQALKGIGYQGFVLPTTVARGGATNANYRTYAIARVNQNVRSNAATLGYTVSDRQAVPQAQDATNTAYFQTDQIHWNDVLGAMVATVDKNAQLAEFSRIGAAVS